MYVTAHRGITVLSRIPKQWIPGPFLRFFEWAAVRGYLVQYSHMMPKTINNGQWWDTTHATEAPPTIKLPSSGKYWCSPMVSSPLSHVRFSLAFCSGSTQFSCTRSAVTEYKSHLQLKRSTTEWHKRPRFCVLCAVQKPQNSFTEIWQRYRCRAWYRNPPYLIAFYGYAHFSWSCELYVEVTWKLNPKP